MGQAGNTTTGRSERKKAVWIVNGVTLVPFPAFLFALSYSEDITGKPHEHRRCAPSHMNTTYDRQCKVCTLKGLRDW